MKKQITKWMALVACLLFGIGGVSGASYIPEVTRIITKDTIVYAADITASAAATSWVLVASSDASNQTYSNVLTTDTEGNPGGITDNLPTTSAGMLKVSTNGSVYNSSKKVVHMTVTGITGIIVHGTTTSTGRGITLSVNEADGLSDSDEMNEVASVTRTTVKGSFLTQYQNLNASTEYVISIYAAGGDAYFYAAELITPSILAPTNFSVDVNCDNNNVDMSWDASTGATEYKITYSTPNMVETFSGLQGGATGNTKDEAQGGSNSDLDNPTYFYDKDAVAYNPQYGVEEGVMLLTDSRFLVKVDDATKPIKVTFRMKSGVENTASALSIYKKASASGGDKIGSDITVSADSYADYEFTIPANTLEEASGSYYFQPRAAGTTNVILFDQISVEIVEGNTYGSITGITSTSTSEPISSFTTGKEYAVKIIALNGADKSKESDAVKFMAGCYTLTLSANDVAYGTVSASPDLTSYPYGAIVTLTATPENNYKFSSWDGINGAEVDNNNEITMNEDKIVVANFGVASSITSPTNSSKTIALEEFYTLTGVQIQTTDASGIYIKKITYDDGSVEAIKFVK